MSVRRISILRLNLHTFSSFALFAALFPAAILASSAANTQAQASGHPSTLQQKLQEITSDAKGKVAVACALPGSSLNCDLNAHSAPPMQSVFKAPLALAVLHQVELGKLSLDQPIRFLPSDRILPRAYSPLWDKYPQANVDVPLRELLRLAVSLSDNVAADILLRIAGGEQQVADYIASLGVTGFHLQDNENALHHDVAVQYRNTFEPTGAVQFLRLISDHSPLTPEHTALLLDWMDGSRLSTRIGGDLPAGVRVAHKSGTSDVDAGLAHATNDIGLITLPDGRKLAIAVFITDSRADDATRDKIIARIARAAYNAAVSLPQP
jgi:beta-lactamase class A